jgi:HSP20 family protein
MKNKKRGFFERLTGGIRMDDDMLEEHDEVPDEKQTANWMETDNDEAELAVDVYQTPTDIVIQTFVAGVRPENLDLTIARDTITISGKREENRNVGEDNYFIKELYWGKFSRTISLPQEIEPEEAEATERHGLLTIRLEKIDKDKKTNIKVKSV